VRDGIVTLVVGTLALGIAGCGSSDEGSSEAEDLTVAGVQGCLEDAGFGVTVVPTDDVVDGGANNRGPDQTGELLVGANGAQPAVDADEAGAVVAFWDSAEHASSSPNAKDPKPGFHADAFGSITVQPTKLAGSPEVDEIEGCVQPG
jgi:hypothetical protein